MSLERRCGPILDRRREVSLKDYSRLIDDVMELAFQTQVSNALSVLKFTDGFSDEYTDESGIDTGGSTGQTYNSSTKLYTPSQSGGEIDSYTVLAIHANEANNSTTPADSSASAHTLTANGDAKVSTGVFKALTGATGSLLFDGTGDFFEIAASTDFDFGSGHWSIDTQAYGDFGPGNTGILSKTYRICMDQSGTQIFADDGTQYIFSFTNADNTFYHYEWTRSGNNLYAFQNGVAASENPRDCTGKTFSGAGVTFRLGDDRVSAKLIGRLQETRISKGIARHTSGFTPPTAQYTSPTTNNMTLLSNAQTATAVPTLGRIIIREQDIDAVTINTDLLAYISRDGGTTYTQVALVLEGPSASSIKIYAGSVDISGQPSGTSMKYKIVTANSKLLDIHATALTWK